MIVRDVIAVSSCGRRRAVSPKNRSRAPDGVIINDEGLPQYSTFSLCAIDPATGQSGAAVTTRVPFVGRAVPHVRAGVGAVCTQASTMVEYGPRGLDLLAKGSSRRRSAAVARRRSAARIASGRRHRHEGPQRRTHGQEQRQLGWQPPGEELHRAGQHHGRARSRRGGGGILRGHRRHGHVAGGANDSRAWRPGRPRAAIAAGATCNRRPSRSPIPTPRAAAATTSRWPSRSVSIPNRLAR